ncbi:MAG: hypothetical protein Q4D85_12485 [Corynebacterium sp.]|uniref:hypothetical protein n=1 Tax=Corynebacterium sp. TaxID=1720 RepID=UPI0026DCF646|nr:hypothetical protein [Corynebacterium sp.]MDO5099550.1 hypothetical protein [Corynebacterium sp.]
MTVTVTARPIVDPVDVAPRNSYDPSAETTSATPESTCFVSVHIRPRTDQLCPQPPAAVLCKPVATTDHGGVYEVCSIATHYPLVPGDLLKASVGPDAHLYLRGIKHLKPGWYMRSQLTTISSETSEVIQTLDRTADTIDVESGYVCGHWSADYSFEQLAEMLNKLQPHAGLAVVFHELARKDWLNSNVDFSDRFLNGGVSADGMDCDYLAAADPAWYKRGIATPDFLSHVQKLVEENPELLQLIQSGAYNKALTWINTYDLAART